jgi:hypothetical protein
MTPARQITVHNGFFPVGPDEHNYLAHATAVVYGHFSYVNESTKWYPPNHAIGPSALALPAVFLFSLIDRAIHAPVVLARNDATLLSSWTAFGFACGTQLWLVIGALFLHLTLVDALRLRRAAGTVVVSLVSSGLLYYAYRRSISSHVYEFATISAAIYLLWRDPSFGGRFWLKWTVTAIVSIFIFLSRYNDFPIAVAFLWASLARDFSPGDFRGWLREQRARELALVTIGALVLIAVVLAMWSSRLPGDRGGFWQVDKVRAHFLTLRSASYYLQRTVHVFFGPDFGLVMTAPLVLMGLFHACRFRSYRYLSVPLLLALLVNFALTISWPTQGSGWGYRYFFPAALPIATLGLGTWIDAGEKPSLRLAYCSLIALVPVVLMLMFGTEFELSLSFGKTRWGSGWINNDYIGQTFGLILHQPRHALGDLLRGSGLPALLDWAGADPELEAPARGGAAFKLVFVWTLPLMVGAVVSTVGRWFDRTK